MHLLLRRSACLLGRYADTPRGHLAAATRSEMLAASGITAYVGSLSQVPLLITLVPEQLGAQIACTLAEEAEPRALGGIHLPERGLLPPLDAELPDDHLHPTFRKASCWFGIVFVAG